MYPVNGTQSLDKPKKVELSVLISSLEFKAINLKF